MFVKEIEAKSILTPSKLPDADFVVNPYIGCRFGCTYCYASFMGKFVNKKTKDWGEYVFAKVNAPALLREEIIKFRHKGREKSILFSSVTDPYQGMEAKYKLTRTCLKVLAEYKFAGTVGILTKSDLILRDLDILSNLKNVDIGMTITSTDDSISRYFEKFAPNATTRLATMKLLVEKGFKTYVFIGPLLPHFIAEPDKLDALFKAIYETGNRDIYIEHINLSKYILNRFILEMKDLDQNILKTFYTSQTKKYREELDAIVLNLVDKYHFHLRLAKPIYHQDSKTSANKAEN